MSDDETAFERENNQRLKIMSVIPVMLDCPFCEGRPVIREYPTTRIDGKPCGESMWGVDCSNCGCQTATDSEHLRPVMDWNKRSLSPLRTLHRALRELLEAMEMSPDDLDIYEYETIVEAAKVNAQAALRVRTLE